MPYYNHNDHYADLVARQRPPNTRTALDVGCGDNRLLRPGGALAVLGLHRSRSAVDLAADVVAVPVNAWLAWRHPAAPSEAPTLPPAMSLGEVRAEAGRILPGARVQRLLLWRHLLTWTAPLT